MEEWLLQLLRSDFKELPKSSGFYGALSEEVGRLWQRFGRQREELEELRKQRSESLQLLERLRSAVLPGRLASTPLWAVAEAVEQQEVRLKGTVVPVEEVQRAKWLARPGSKVMQLHEGASSDGE